MDGSQPPDLSRPALTKILATLGPASDDPETVAKLVEAGARLFRLNFSHGEVEDHGRRLKMVRSVGESLGVPVTVIGDLPGPKLRIGKTPDGGIELAEGQEVAIRADVDVSVAGERPVLASDFDKIVEEVEPGHRVLINDGAVRMLVVSRGDGELVCSVTTGGLVTTRKGLNLPDSKLSVPTVTDKDWALVEWAVAQGIDYLALSFVRSAKEVLGLRQRIRELCVGGACGTGLAADSDQGVPVISKIETPQAVDNIETIVEASDAIMVARGDLGVEMDVAKVPMVQKRLVTAAHAAGKPCIVATQMLESMIEHANPTRAEVSDVANAILDGADCVMLSGETAVGRYPVVAVEMMRRVAEATEEELRRGDVKPTVPEKLRRQGDFIPALAHGAWVMAKEVGATAMVIWSQRGGGARYLSRHNFHIPILALSSDERAVRRMNLLYGVFPVLMSETPEHRSEFARCADRMLIDQGWVERGDPVVMLAGKPLGKPGVTNTVAIRYAGELLE